MVGKRIALIGIVLMGIVTMGFKIGFLDENKNNYKEVKNNESYSPIVVLELFTSQGCSSCPPADALLQQVQKDFKKSVYALSYHVDYWNYIGWEDPFSNPDFTDKQRAYNIKLENRNNYTPQVVVNGKSHFVGSNASEMDKSIAHYGKINVANKIELSAVRTEKGIVTFRYGIDGDIYGKNIRAVLVLDERTTSVKRGENRNRTLENSNIVVAERKIELDALNGDLNIKIPSIVQKNEKLHLIVLVENEKYDITGAVQRGLSNSYNINRY